MPISFEQAETQYNRNYDPYDYCESCGFCDFQCICCQEQEELEDE